MGKGETSAGVTDDSVGVKMDTEVAEGSDGADICTEEVDCDITGVMEVDSTEVEGETRPLNSPLKDECWSSFRQ